MGKTNKRMEPLIKRPPGKPASSAEALSPKLRKQKIRAAEQELNDRFKKDGKQHGVILNEFGDILLRAGGTKKDINWTDNAAIYLSSRPDAIVLHTDPKNAALAPEF